MLFDGPAELPVATLRPAVGRSRRRAILGDLDRWLTHRWAWLRPRTLPLLVAFVSLLTTLGAVKYVMVWSRHAPLRLPMHSAISRTAPHHDGPGPVRILINPLAPGDHYIELTIEGPDPR